MTTTELFKRYEHNPEVLHNFASEVSELVHQYGKYHVLWAIEQLEKKYERKTKS